MTEVAMAGLSAASVKSATLMSYLVNLLTTAVYIHAFHHLYIRIYY